MAETSYARANRLAEERKATHNARMAALVERQAERDPTRFERTGVYGRSRRDWWADTTLWADPGYSPSDLEADTYIVLYWLAWSIEVAALKASQPKPIRVVKPFRPLFEVHVEHLLGAIVINADGKDVRLFERIDLTEPEVAVG